MGFDGIVICYALGVIFFVCLLSYTRYWVDEKWYLIAWFPWTATMLGIVVWWIFYFSSVWWKPGMDGAIEGIVALLALVFVIPALCALIVAVINRPLRVRKFFHVENTKPNDRNLESSSQSDVTDFR